MSMGVRLSGDYATPLSEGPLSKNRQGYDMHILPNMQLSIYKYSPWCREEAKQHYITYLQA